MLSMKAFGSFGSLSAATLHIGQADATSTVNNTASATNVIHDVRIGFSLQVPSVAVKRC